jgi:probable DNA metabolism protein
MDGQPKLEIRIHETDFDGWRQAARALVLDGVTPEDVMWSIKGEEELFAPGERQPQPRSSTETFSVSARFVELAKIAILHRDPRRFAMLYRLLWRLRCNHDLLEVATDPDVTSVTAMAKAVRRAEHKMHAFVRFREIGRERDAHYVAWFEPEHHVVELAAPFFARRFADMPWSILTPECCAHWDGFAISFTSGVSKAMAPTSDRLEETWRCYYATVLNPARLR